MGAPTLSGNISKNSRFLFLLIEMEAAFCYGKFRVCVLCICMLFPIPRMPLHESIREGYEDGEEAEGGEEEAVPHVGDDVQGVHGGAGGGGEGGGGEELGAVGDEALEDAGEDVQEGGGFAWVDAEFLADFLRHVAGDDDGYRVVGGGAVHQGDEGRDGEFRALHALHEGRQFPDEPGDAAVVGDEFRHAAAEEGEEEGFVHGGEAFPDGLREADDREVSLGEPDAAGEEDADGEHQEHIRPQERQEEHHQIGEDLEEGVASRGGQGFARCAPQEEGRGGEEGCREGDEEIHFEFIFQRAALGAGGGDGGVGNHGQVVAEHGAGHAGRHDEGGGNAALLPDARRDGDDGSHGTHGGTGGGAHEGGNEEDAAGEVLRRHQ